MASVFQPISENFVWEFTAQDVVALWIPRIINALRRGRHPYDPNEDPSLREGKPLQQWLHSVVQNTKGLNWSNAREESYREFETGPGIFIAPSIIFALGSSAVLGHLALQMSNKDLHTYTNALTQLKPTLKGAGDADAVAQQFFQHLLENGHFKPHLNQPIEIPTPKGTEGVSEKLVKMMNVATGKKNHTGQDALKVWSEMVSGKISREGNLEFLNYEKNHTPGWVGRLAKRSGFHTGEADKMTHLLDRILMQYKDIQLQDVLNTWTHTWKDAQKRHWFDFKGVQQLNELESAFKRITYWVNNNHYPAMATNALRIPALAQNKNDTVKAEALFDNMRKFRGFIQKLYSTHQGQPKQWASAIQKLLQSSTIGKAVLSVIGTAAACFTVVMVSAKAQRGRAYPANRNVQLGTIGTNNTGIAQKPAVVDSPTPQWMPLHSSQNPWANPMQATTASWPMYPPQTASWYTGGVA